MQGRGLDGGQGKEASSPTQTSALSGGRNHPTANEGTLASFFRDNSAPVRATKQQVKAPTRARISEIFKNVNDSSNADAVRAAFPGALAKGSLKIAAKKDKPFFNQEDIDQGKKHIFQGLIPLPGTGIIPAMGAKKGRRLAQWGGSHIGGGLGSGVGSLLGPAGAYAGHALGTPLGAATGHALARKSEKGQRKNASAFDKVAKKGMSEDKRESSARRAAMGAGLASGVGGALQTLAGPKGSPMAQLPGAGMVGAARASEGGRGRGNAIGAALGGQLVGTLTGGAAMAHAYNKGGIEGLLNIHRGHIAAGQAGRAIGNAGGAYLADKYQTRS